MFRSVESKSMLFHSGEAILPIRNGTVYPKGQIEMTTITLNAAARAVDKFSTNGKIRAKLVDGIMFFRPTHRKAPVNLPKDERLVDMAGGKVELEGMELSAGTYGLRADKYGWFALTPDHKGRGPSAKVA